jgi:uncharacterized protein
MAQILMSPLPSLDDPEPRPVASVPGRRTMTASRALLAIVVCLVMWGLLFSPVLERNAESGPIGARRTAALAVLRPLAAISNALSVGRTTGAVMRALGRDPDAPAGGELMLPDFDLPPIPSQPVTSPPPPPPSPQAETHSGAPSPRETGSDRPTPSPDPEPAPDQIRNPTEADKLRVAIVGDSLSQGLGPAVAGLFDTDVSRVLPLGRQSTGLARQDYFNWRAAMRKIVTEFRPDLVFVMLGSNDDQAQITPEGNTVRLGSTAWVQGYRERAKAFLEEATSAGTRVVWVGIPVVAERQHWEFYRRVNDIYEDVALEAGPMATYVDAWRLFEARDGGYTAYLRNDRGDVQQMRAGDGLHLTPTGYGYLGRSAIQAAAEAFGLPQKAVVFRI